MHRPRFLRTIQTATLMVCLLCTQTAFAASNSPSPLFTPSPQTLSRLTQFIHDQMRTHHVVGLSITVVNDQQIIYSHGFGHQNREENTVATEHTVYRMGSISKVLTAVAVMQLVEQKRIALDAPVTRYLPQFCIQSRFQQPTNITVRQLLTHHSGLPTDLMKGADSLTPVSLETLVTQLQKENLAQSPGRVFQYSNIGYALLGRIIEVVSGTSYSEYMQQHIFTPLHMNKSRFFASADIQPLLATGYINGTPGIPYKVREVSAGALYSSTSDLAQFIKTVFRNGVPLVSADSQKQMLTRQNENVPLDLDISTGLGWQLTNQLPEDRNAGPTVWHDGWIWHFSSSLLLLPRHKLGVIVATNTDAGKPVVKRIAQKAIKLLLWQKAGVERYSIASSAASGKLTDDELAPYAGYYDTASGIFHLTAQNGVLEGFKNGQPIVLEPLTDGRFQMKRKLNSLVSWQSDDLAGVFFEFVNVENHIILATLDGSERIPFAHRISPVPISPYWDHLVGTYINTPQDSDFVYVQSIRIQRNADFLTAIVDIAGHHTNVRSFELMLKPEGKKRAVVMGIGRYRGDTLQVIHNGKNGVTLRFQGYTLKKK
ncbi:MAG: beta-lactamase family protein [Deltaproteobacteria bacterium]|nr:beta-lactamase family protein [Deltaproteobacteria bacterium]MBN2670651.1 beta-lactamase family protein [Deltaproteobacteria bacterium]